MPETTHAVHRQLAHHYREAFYDLDPRGMANALRRFFDAKATIQLAHPFNDVGGPEAYHTGVLRPLLAAIPDLERRDTIVMAGSSGSADWVGCCGFYTGVFRAPWLDIPPTGHQVSMRFHEFYRMENDKAVEMQALWDIPELMMQAGVWPMSPSLGREWHVPGPATQNGFLHDAYDEAMSRNSVKLVNDMLTSLGNFADWGVEGMALERYWHPKLNWYGPSGIGTGRGVAGFRKWHQIPFLKAMPDRQADVDNGHLFGDGDFVGFTAWPGMSATLSGDGWLGIAPADQQITMRSLDFWRCERGLIRENWVLVDLLDIYAQIGIDVFARMRERTPLNYEL